VYQRTFEVLLANTEALRKQAFRLRYQVYCVEHPFLKTDPRIVSLRQPQKTHFNVSAHSPLIVQNNGYEYRSCVRQATAFLNSSIPGWYENIPVEHETT